MKLKLIALFLFSPLITIHAQCGNVTLFSQAEVNAWVATNPNCTTIDSLQIGTEVGSIPSDINDLSGLMNIQEIESGLFITNNPLLTNLNGLQNLNSSGLTIEIRNNDALISIAALSNITSNIYLSIINNNNLSSLTGLEGITIAYAVYISHNDALQNLNGLNNLQNIPSGVLDIFNCNGLINLTGLESLNSNSVGIVSISQNDNLLNLEGLNNLALVIFNLTINANPVLEDISALENLEMGGPISAGLYLINISNNPDLSFCSYPWLCNLIPFASDPDVNLSGNASGCNTEIELTNNCGIGAIEGTLFFDENQDCILDANPIPLGGWKIIANSITGIGTKFTFTDSLGNYSMGLYQGTYELLAEPPNDLWTVCDVAQPYSISTGSLYQVDFLAHTDSDCELLNVQIGTPFFRRCFENQFTVNWFNATGVEIPDAYVEVVVAELLTDITSPFPFTINTAGNLIFDIGDVGIGGSGSLQFTGTLSCDAELGQTLCFTATIHPGVSCSIAGGNWSGADIFIDGSCDNDSLSFEIYNLGIGSMTDSLTYRLYKNANLITVGNFQLGLGESFTLTLPADTCTYRIETDQVPNFPLQSTPSVTIEGCLMTGSYSSGYFLIHPIEDYGASFDRLCMSVIGAYDPNDKLGFPLGYGANNYITPDQPIEYLIRFQNTGTDTAFNVVVLDTMSSNFEITSLELGVSSHPFRFELLEENIFQFSFDNIMLPDSNINELASHGFLSFSIRQLPNPSIGTEYYNSASIYFDFNDPIQTNTTYHSIGIATNIDSESILLCEGDSYEGIVYTQNTTLADTITYGVFQNISSTEITVIEPIEIIIDTTLILGTTYNGVVYQMDTILQEMYLNQYGCDSTVITNISIMTTSTLSLTDSDIRIVWSPNPFKDKVIVSVKNTFFNNGILELYNLQGQKIVTQSFQDSNFEFSDNNTPTGVYFYKIILDNEIRVSGKVMKE